MDDKVQKFLEQNHDAVQTTLRKDGSPHVARIGVGLVDGKLWSSATRSRVRTKHLRNDPRSTLFVMNHDDRYNWLGLDCRVNLLEDDPVENNLALYRSITGKDPDDMDEYRRAMIDDGRLVYEFAIQRAYGQF